MAWEEFFGEMEGCAVFYNVNENEYMVYNQELCNTRRSPCSTFKIVSSLIGLESGVINPEDSIRTWSKNIFWNAEWNRDIRFEDSFRTSCVWYFRQVMKTSENENVYGKTGMGKAHGIVAVAWFVGFTFDEEQPIYFCIYLGESERSDVSSTKAKEIALQIISNVF